MKHVKSVFLAMALILPS
ncbi:PagK family vesicle-borne virulence factor, partial [Salmonella enterica subsp. enterica serovar Newport]